MAVPTKKSVNVAILGLGSMGTILARNLAFKGRSALYLQLYSRSAEKAKSLANTIWQDGAQCSIRVHTKPETVAKWSDIIISTLPNAQACRDVYCDDNMGLFRYLRPSTTLVEHTTLDYHSTMDFHERVEGANAYYLDSPLSGNITSAKNGALTIMCGGEEKAYTKVLPLLRLYGETIHLMGPRGTGTLTKMICQQLVAIHTVAAAEAMTLAHHLGIDTHQKLTGVLDASWGSSTMLRRNAPLMERILRNPQEMPQESRSTLRALYGDLERVREVHAKLPLTSLTHELYRKAHEAGASKFDFASIVNYLDSSVEPPATHGQASMGSSGHSDRDVLTNRKKKLRRRKRRNPTYVSALALQRSKDQNRDPNASVEAY